MHETWRVNNLSLHVLAKTVDVISAKNIENEQILYRYFTISEANSYQNYEHIIHIISTNLVRYPVERYVFTSLFFTGPSCSHYKEFFLDKKLDPSYFAPTFLITRNDKNNNWINKCVKVFKDGPSKICGRQSWSEKEVNWSDKADHITSNVLKAVFHKFYSVYSWRT